MPLLRCGVAANGRTRETSGQVAVSESVPDANAAFTEAVAVTDRHVHVAYYGGGEFRVASKCFVE